MLNSSEPVGLGHNLKSCTAEFFVVRGRGDLNQTMQRDGLEHGFSARRYHQ